MSLSYERLERVKVIYAKPLTHDAKPLAFSWIVDTLGGSLGSLLAMPREPQVVPTTCQGGAFWATEWDPNKRTCEDC